MNNFAVYNLHDDIYAHNLFSIQHDDDVFSNVYVDVIANVYVEDAAWREEYRSPGLLHKPYMEIKGKVTSVFLEDTDQRTFPCGARTLILKDIMNTGATGVAPDKPQSVIIRYVLSIEEMAQVCGMGLFAQANDMTVPDNLIGNTIEIPVPVRYMGVYDTPIAGVEILDPYNLRTCTRENNYYDIFSFCQPSAEVEAEKHVNYEFYPHLEYDNEISPVYDDLEAEGEMEAEVSEEQQAEPADDEFEVKQDDANRSAVQSLVEQYVAQMAAKRAETASHRDERNAVSDRVRSYLDARAREKYDERETTLSDAIFGAEGTDNREIGEEKAVYEDFKTAVLAEDAKHGVPDLLEADYTSEDASGNLFMTEDISIVPPEPEAPVQSDEAQETRAEREEKESIESVRRADRAADNMLMNEGITDTAGFTSASEASDKSGSVTDDAQTEAVNTAQSPVRLQAPLTGIEILRKLKEGREGKTQIQNARMADIAADNKAMNEGITDIAGQGAASQEKPVAKQESQMVSHTPDAFAPVSAQPEPVQPAVRKLAEPEFKQPTAADLVDDILGSDIPNAPAPSYMASANDEQQFL